MDNAIAAAIVGVRNQPKRMFISVRLSTVLIPFIMPTPKTAPITA